MPVVLSESANPHLDVPFRVRPPGHRWHARQSTTTVTNNNTYLAIFAVVFVFVTFLGAVRFVKRAQRRRLTRGAPRPVVQGPPGSQRGPVITEILTGIREVVIGRRQGNRDMHAAVPSSAPIYAQYPPEAMVRPSRPMQTIRLPLVNGNNHVSRAPLDAQAGVAQAGGPPPPPYASVSLA